MSPPAQSHRPDRKTCSSTSGLLHPPHSAFSTCGGEVCGWPNPFKCAYSSKTVKLIILILGNKHLVGNIIFGCNCTCGINQIIPSGAFCLIGHLCPLYQDEIRKTKAGKLSMRLCNTNSLPFSKKDRKLAAFLLISLHKLIEVFGGNELFLCW